MRGTAVGRKVSIFGLAVLWLYAGLIGCAPQQTIPARPEQVASEEMVEFSIPTPERWTLPNGLTVLYYFNDELPQMRGTMYFPGGQLTDRSGIAGLPEATGSQMREGSIQGIAPDELDKRLDDLAASIEARFGDEYGSVGFYSLEEDFSEVFGLFTKVIRTPAFDRTRLELWKQLAQDSILRRRDSPDTMAGMTFSRLLYGEDSAFAKAPSPESIKKITPDLLHMFHRQYVRPDGAYLAITGSIKREEIERAIEERFGDWPKGTYERPEIPGVEHEIKPGVYVLERDFDQATVLIGHRGPSRHTPDLYGLRIYNHLFGHSGFGSVLFNKIRSQLGLAYSVYGGVFPGVVEGVFQIGLGTRTAEAARAIDKALELAAESTENVPETTEFKDAKSAVSRSFVFRFAEPSYIVNRVAVLELSGYPPDFDETYLERIDELEPKQIENVAARWVHPERVVVVVVGNVSARDLAELYQDRMNVHRVTFDTEPHIESEPIKP